MKTHQGIRLALLAAVLAAFGVSGVALAADPVPEREPNHPIGSAQKLTATIDPLVSNKGSVTVSGVIGTNDTAVGTVLVLDADFYSFYGKEGDVVTIDIDGGMVKSSGRRVDTILTLFRPYSKEAGYELKVVFDNVSRLVDSSIQRFDARLDKVLLDATGMWTVGVTGFPGFLDNGGIFLDTKLGALSNGAYTLTISGVSPEEIPINIDIKPGGRETPPINPKSKGNIPVALLSSAEFDALTVDVDPKTLKFGATGEELSLLRCNKNGVDFNRDGRLDLLCFFENELTKFDSDDFTGTVKGVTKDGTAFRGIGNLKVVPVKREDN